MSFTVLKMSFPIHKSICLIATLISFANSVRVDIYSPTGIHYFGDDTQHYSYHGGRDFCNAQGGTLARPRTVHEFSWLVHELNTWRYFWIDEKEETKDSKYILQNGETFPLGHALKWYETTANTKTRCSNACCVIRA